MEKHIQIKHQIDHDMIPLNVSYKAICGTQIIYNHIQIIYHIRQYMILLIFPWHGALRSR